MKEILSFDFQSDLVISNQASLSDTIRMALYQADSELFSLLDYDNDYIFLEPTLFCHFLSDIDKSTTISLIQSLIGYIPIANRPNSIHARADKFGMANLPNLGYNRANPHEIFVIRACLKML